MAKAQHWRLTKSQWQKMPEPDLLNRSKTLRTELEALTSGSPAPGAAFGITTASVTAFSALVDNYDQQIGGPGDARADRKAMTGQLRDRYRDLRQMLQDIDGMIEGLRRQSADHNLFVDGYFNARRIGGHPSEEEEEPPTPPAPPTP